MNKKFGSLLALCTIGLGLLMSSGCGTSNFNAYYSGNWTGTMNSQAIVNTQLFMSLYQSGTNITGDFVAQSSTTQTTNPPISGSVTGTVSGSTMTLTFTVLAGEIFPGGASNTTTPTQSTTNLTLGGTFTLNGSTVTGTATGTGTVSGTTSSATVTLTQSK